MHCSKKNDLFKPPESINRKLINKYFNVKDEANERFLIFLACFLRFIILIIMKQYETNIKLQFLTRRMEHETYIHWKNKKCLCFRRR